MRSEAFYLTMAQVLPTLLIVVAIELRTGLRSAADEHLASFDRIVGLLDRHSALLDEVIEQARVAGDMSETEKAWMGLQRDWREGPIKNELVSAIIVERDRKNTYRVYRLAYIFASITFVVGEAASVIGAVVESARPLVFNCVMAALLGLGILAVAVPYFLHLMENDHRTSGDGL